MSGPLARSSSPMTAVVARYQNRLRLHAFRILHDVEEAQDVVQEVFVRALLEPRLFDADFQVQAWLYRVTRNLCFNYARNLRHRRARLLAVHDAASNGAASQDPLAALLTAEQREALLKVIDALAPSHAEVLRLRYYDGLTYHEIQGVIGDIQLGTVMSRLNRGKAALRPAVDRAGYFYW